MFPFRTVDVHDHHSQWSVTVAVDDGLIDCRPSEFGKGVGVIKVTGCDASAGHIVLGSTNLANHFRYRCPVLKYANLQ